MIAFPRRTGVASLATLAACVVAFLVLNLLVPQWAQAAGLDVWNVEAAVAVLKQEKVRERELDDAQDQLAEQIAACDAVVADLIAGRIALPSAVDWVEDINRERPGFASVLIHIDPDAHSHRERIEQYTIAKVRAKLAGDPTRLAAVLDRLGTGSAQ